MLIPQTHFPPSPRRPTRWKSCGQVHVAGKKSQIVKGYFKKSVGKKGILGFAGCDAAIFSRSSTLFCQDFSERAMRSRSHVGGYEGSFDVDEREGRKAYVPASLFWKSAITKKKTITIAAIRPCDIVSYVVQTDATRMTNLSTPDS